MSMGKRERKPGAIQENDQMKELDVDDLEKVNGGMCHSYGVKRPVTPGVGNGYNNQSFYTGTYFELDGSEISEY